MRAIGFYFGYWGMMRPEPRNSTLFAFFAVLWLAVLSADAVQVAAQDAPAGHADGLADVIATCLAPVFGADAAGVGSSANEPAFRLAWGGGYPFLETRLAARLLDAGVELGGGDTPVLRVDLERADIVYRRAGGRTLERTVSAGIAYAVTLPDGSVQQADVCQGSLTDRMDRKTAASLTDPQSGLTQPELPRTGIWSRYLEPAVLVGATAIGTYLFFNLRSRRADSG